MCTIQCLTEIYVPVLMFAYKTNFYRPVEDTPFSLMYGLKAQLPSSFAPVFCHMHDPDQANDNPLTMKTMK